MATDTLNGGPRPATPRLSPIFSALFPQQVLAPRDPSTVAAPASPTTLNGDAPLATPAPALMQAGPDINGTHSEASYLSRLKFAMTSTDVAVDARYRGGEEDSAALMYLNERSEMELTMASYHLLQKIRDAHAEPMVAHRSESEPYTAFGERMRRVLMVLFVSKAACRDVFEDLEGTGTYLAEKPKHAYASAINGRAASNVNALHRHWAEV